MTTATAEATAEGPPARPPLVRRKPPAPVRRRRFLIGVANHSVLIFFAVLFLAPFMFIVLTSLMTNQQAAAPHRRGHVAALDCGSGRRGDGVHQRAPPW